MNSLKSVGAREPDKGKKPKKKRNLDNSALKTFFGKGSLTIWQKDIDTGEGNFSF